jgi:hypothetical protein
LIDGNTEEPAEKNDLLLDSMIVTDPEQTPESFFQEEGAKFAFTDGFNMGLFHWVWMCNFFC